MLPALGAEVKWSWKRREHLVRTFSEPQPLTSVLFYFGFYLFIYFIRCYLKPQLIPLVSESLSWSLNVPSFMKCVAHTLQTQTLTLVAHRCLQSGLTCDMFKEFLLLPEISGYYDCGERRRGEKPVSREYEKVLFKKASCHSELGDTFSVWYEAKWKCCYCWVKIAEQNPHLTFSFCFRSNIYMASQHNQ